MPNKLKLYPSQQSKPQMILKLLPLKMANKYRSKLTHSRKTLLRKNREKLRVIRLNGRSPNCILGWLSSSKSFQKQIRYKPMKSSPSKSLNNLNLNGTLLNSSLGRSSLWLKFSTTLVVTSPSLKILKKMIF